MSAAKKGTDHDIAARFKFVTSHVTSTKEAVFAVLDIAKGRPPVLSVVPSWTGACARCGERPRHEVCGRFIYCKECWVIKRRIAHSTTRAVHPDRYHARYLAWMASVRRVKTPEEMVPDARFRFVPKEDLGLHEDTEC